jgi:hypothetical protein
MPEGTRTPISSGQALGALRAAGAGKGLIVVAAQSALETAGWSAMWNWNFGNITTTGSDYVTLPGNALHFQAYASEAEGASAFIAYLRAKGLLGLTGDLAAYVERLKEINYAGDTDYGAYEAGIARWITQLGGVVPVSPGLISAPVALGAAAAGVWAWRAGWIEKLWGLVRLR